ncbi:hypothetical protein GF312_11180 [Candidatus Poribacteria bacterium]|nr:hypothetical protein [Candidatus Poribacteria bacterium]
MRQKFIEKEKILYVIILTFVTSASTYQANASQNISGVNMENQTRIIIDGVDRYRVKDPMFESIRIILSKKGEKYSPAYIQGISGAAFRIAGPCPCAPTCSLAYEPTEFVELMGYEMEHLDLSDDKIVPDEEVLKITPRIKEEIRAGHPVLVWHAFTFAEWDVVFGFDDEKKQFIGYGSYDRYMGEDGELAVADEKRMATCLDICPAYGAILIGDKVREFDASEAELSALEEAVRHAHSPGDIEKPNHFHEGLVCYDVWVHDFKSKPDHKVPYSGDYYTLGWCKSIRGAAAEFMRELAPKYPDVSKHFLNAAQYFETESNILGRIGNEVFKGYKDANPEKAYQAAKLLTKARDNYAKGIKEIEMSLKEITPERAIQARNPAEIKRENGKVWIKNIRNLKFGEGQDCTFAGAVAEAMKVSQHPYKYEDIMGLSGLAFRVRWCNDKTETKWCPSCAIGEMPDEQKNLIELTGWSLPTEWLDADGRDNEKLRKKIVASIDAGKPVVAYPEHWNMALIYGYEDNGKILLISDYMKDEHPAKLPVEKLVGLQTYLGDHNNPHSYQDVLLKAMQNAVKNWKREKHNGGIEGREYWYGEAAFSAWINDLKEFDNLAEESQQGLDGINWWNYTSLYDARISAVKFLRSWSNVLGGEKREALKRAVKIYEYEVKVLEALLDDKWNSGEEQSRSEEVRLQEIRILKEALKLESKAISEIESIM